MEEVREFAEGILLSEAEMDRLAEQAIGDLDPEHYDFLFEQAARAKEVYRLFEMVLKGDAVVEVSLVGNTRLNFIGLAGRRIH